MRLLRILAVVGLFVTLCGVQAVLADGLSIIITQTGKDYYEWNVTVGSTNYSSGWIEQTPVNNVGYDDMTIAPGGSATVGNTQYFSLQSGLSFVAAGRTFSVLETGSSYWRPTSAGDSTEAALIVTSPGAPSSSSTVQNLLVEDGTGGIFLYKAPTLNATNHDVTNSTNGVGENAYGYESAWNPASHTPNVPITELGTKGEVTGADTGVGLEGALESNAGFLKGGDATGTDNGENIGVGGEEMGLTNPDPSDGLGTFFNGYVFSGSVSSNDVVTGDQPGTVREGDSADAGGFAGYLDPTIYMEESTDPTPLPSAFWCGLGLMGLLVLMNLRTSRRIQA
jgi:hypothetical protein